MSASSFESDPGETLDSDGDAKKSGPEKERELDEIAKGTVKQVFAQQANAISTSNVQVKAITAKMNTALADIIAVDTSDSEYSSSGTESDAEKDDDNNTAEEIRRFRKNAGDYQRDEVGEKKRADRTEARIKAASLSLAIVGGAVGLTNLCIALYNALKKPAASDPPSTELDPELKKLLEERVKLWKALPEDAMWGRVVTYCDGFNPSWQAQIFIANMIKTIADDAPAGWQWQGNDEASRVSALVDAYESFKPPPGQARSRILYTNAPTLTYDGLKTGTATPLPRKVAADVVNLAIVQIILLTKGSNT